MFDLGQLVAASGALDTLQRNNQSPSKFIRRHVNHDWGGLDDEDKEDDKSVEDGFRILSAYTLRDQTRIWIITEADRSVTTILLPSEYWSPCCTGSAGCRYGSAHEGPFTHHDLLANHG